MPPQHGAVRRNNAIATACHCITVVDSNGANRNTAATTPVSLRDVDGCNKLEPAVLALPVAVAAPNMPHGHSFYLFKKGAALVTQKSRNARVVPPLSTSGMPTNLCPGKDKVLCLICVAC